MCLIFCPCAGELCEFCASDTLKYSVRRHSRSRHRCKTQTETQKLYYTVYCTLFRCTNTLCMYVVVVATYTRCTPHIYMLYVYVAARRSTISSPNRARTSPGPHDARRTIEQVSECAGCTRARLCTTCCCCWGCGLL